MTAPEHPLLAALLGVPAVIYGGAIRIRNRLYERPGAVSRAELPVVSVGNLTVGGTGKTPMVEWLARRLLERGSSPAVVSRGYGGRAGKGPLVVSRGAGPVTNPAECGDEPYLLAKEIPELRVVVGSDRILGARMAKKIGGEIVLLDDGFQHRRLARDLDIVLLDASNPFGNYRMLPAGLLREPVKGLGRADVVVITRSRRSERFELIEKVVRHHNPRGMLLRAGHRPLGFFDGDGRPVERPARAVAFCGIGNPSRFRIDVEAEGVELAEFRAFRDHRQYDAKELNELRRLSEQHGVPLLTTEKDRVRIGDALGGGLLTMRIEAVLYEPEPLLAAIHGLIEGRRR